MDKILAVISVILIVISFGSAQTGDQETRSGVSDPGVPDSPNETTDEENEQSSEDEETEDSGNTSSCGKSPNENASSTAKKVLNTIFCTVGNIGDALSSLLGGGN